MPQKLDIGVFSVIDTDSSIGVGWLLNFYLIGTSTRKATYPTLADAIALTNPNPNPVPIPNTGRLPDIWLLDDAEYKGILTDELGVPKETKNPIMQNIVGALAAPTGSGSIGFIHTGTGAVARTAQAKMRDEVSVLDFGTTASIANDARTAFDASIKAHFSVFAPSGDYTFITNQPNEYQYDGRYVQGDGSVTALIADNPDKEIFRFGAIGGTGTYQRPVTLLSDFLVKRPGSAAATDVFTAWDAQSVHPLIAERVSLEYLGYGAIKLRSIYYGYDLGLYLTDSGMLLENINKRVLYSCEVRADNRAVIDGGPGEDQGGVALFGALGRKAIELYGCNQVTFHGGIVEGWGCPSVLVSPVDLGGSLGLCRSHTVTWDNFWWEGNPCTHVIESYQHRSLNFINNQLDLAFPISDGFIRHSRAGPSAETDLTKSVMRVNIDGGYLLTTSSGVFVAETNNLVTTVSDAPVVVAVRGLDFRGNRMKGSRSVAFYVASIELTTENHHIFYTRPTIQKQRRYNPWVPESANTDWDFASIANWSSTGTAPAVTTTDGEYLSGTRAVKFAGLTAGATSTISMTAAYVAAADSSGGKRPSLLCHSRWWFDKAVDVVPQINGGAVDYLEVMAIPFQSGVWMDIIFKPGVASTIAQGSGASPTIKFLVTVPSGGGNGTGICDFIDLQWCDGDIMLEAD